MSDDPRPRAARRPPEGDYQYRAWCGLGWPKRTAFMMQDADESVPSGRWIGMWSVSLRGQGYSIAYLPHWPGLLGNVLFYMMLVLTPVVLWRWLRLRRRAKRGQCLACEYVAADLGVCPECGLAREG